MPAKKEESKESIECTICRTKLASKSELTSHLKTDEHKKMQAIKAKLYAGDELMKKQQKVMPENKEQKK